MADTTTEVEIALLQKEMEDLRKEVHTLSKEVAGLVDAWKTASGVVAFVKWLAGISAAISVLWAAFKIKVGGV